MTVETIQFQRSPQGTFPLIGQGSNVSGSGPGGTFFSNAYVFGWDATMGMACRHQNLEAQNQSFGSNGGANFQGNRANFHTGALFPPYGVGNRVMRYREVIRFRCTQADVNNPLSRCFYGLFVNADAGSFGAGLLPQTGWIGFYTAWTGTTPANWRAVITDDTAVVLHDVDLGFSSDAPHLMRVDIDPIENEIRFYVDEVLATTYVPSPGDFDVTIGTIPMLGYMVNPGYIVGAVVNTIVDCWSEVMCSSAALHSWETP